MEPTFDGFIVPIPSAGIPQGLYVPPDKSYKVIPPAGWRILSGDAGEVQFRSVVADQGYWPGMFIAKEPAKWPIGPKKEAKIKSAVAEDREDFGKLLPR